MAKRKVSKRKAAAKKAERKTKRRDTRKEPKRKIKISPQAQQLIAGIDSRKAAEKKAKAERKEKRAILKNIIAQANDMERANYTPEIQKIAKAYGDKYQGKTLLLDDNANYLLEYWNKDDWVQAWQDDKWRGKYETLEIRGSLFWKIVNALKQLRPDLDSDDIIDSTIDFSIDYATNKAIKDATELAELVSKEQRGLLDQYLEGMKDAPPAIPSEYLEGIFD